MNYWIESEFQHMGYDCVCVAFAKGYRCGYVSVPKGHPAYCEHYDDIHGIDVHGGLTFSDMGNGETLPKGKYWLGFDCSHSDDALDLSLTTSMPNAVDLNLYRLLYGDTPSERGTIRTLEYVQAECRRLAEQLHEMEEVTNDRN